MNEYWLGATNNEFKLEGWENIEKGVGRPPGDAHPFLVAPRLAASTLLIAQGAHRYLMMGKITPFPCVINVIFQAMASEKFAW